MSDVWSGLWPGARSSILIIRWTSPWSGLHGLVTNLVSTDWSIVCYELVTGLNSGLYSGLVSGLYPGLCSCLVPFMVSGPVFSMVPGPVFVLISSLVSALVPGLVSGQTSGLVTEVHVHWSVLLSGLYGLVTGLMEEGRDGVEAVA